MTTHLGLQRILLPSAQVSSLTTGSITLPSARGAFVEGDFESIATITVGSGGSSSIEFTSIPATYKHLQIRGMYLGAASFDFQRIQFNNDTTNANYYSHNFAGNGTSASTGPYAGSTYGAIIYGVAVYPSTTYPASFVMDILDYTSTNKNKTTRTLIGYDTNVNGYIEISEGLWKATPAAISSIKIFEGGNRIYQQYSSFALYGIGGS